MSICVSDLREFVIKPSLEALGDYSPLAEQLLTATAAQESRLGSQLYSGPNKGMGLYRMTAVKHWELWDKYLVGFPELASRQRGLASQQQFLRNPDSELITNLSYCTGIAWMVYRRAGIDTSRPVELAVLAQLWASHFDNGTQSVRATDDFIHAYRTLVQPDLHRRAA